LSVGCPKPLEQCQGCSASDERREQFDRGYSEFHLVQATRRWQQANGWPARSVQSAAPLHIVSGIKCGACNCSMSRECTLAAEQALGSSLSVFVVNFI